MLEQNNMRHIIYNLFAVALLLALPIAINAQSTKNDTTTIPKWAKTFPASLTLEDIKKLAEDGNADAQFEIGIRYNTGRGGLPQDFDKCAYWFEKAAKQGDAMSQFFYGVCYFNGQGVPQDFKQAAYWTRKSAEQGYPTAQLVLGYNYLDGNGVERDKEQAAYWFKQAADQGNEQAKAALEKLEKK